MIVENNPDFFDIPWGGLPDPEDDGQPHPGALGDDNDVLYPSAGDDEDGVIFTSPIVLGGSVLTRARPIAERVRTRLLEQWPDAVLERTASGEAGAVALALRTAGVAVTAAVLERLRRSDERRATSDEPEGERGSGL